MAQGRELRAQFVDAVAVARMAAEFFAGRLAAAEIRPARERAKDSARKAAAAEKGDGLALSRRLEEACDAAWRAVEEAARFEAGDKRFLPMAEELAAALERLQDASVAGGDEAVAAVVEAKRRALEIERMHRAVRKSSHEDPRFVDGLKNGAVGQRLSAAAEGVQAACDVLTEVLGGAA